MYIYEIDAFAYSMFEHHILVHEKEFSKQAFTKMIELARQKVIKEKDDKVSWSSYPDDFIRVLINDYGFQYSNHLTAYVGGGHKDTVKVDYEDR